MPGFDVRQQRSCDTQTMPAVATRAKELPGPAEEVHRNGSAAARSSTRVRRHGPVVSTEVDRLPGAPQSLAEHLSGQVRVMPLAFRTGALAEWIIGNLDADGYLRDDLGRLASMVSATLDEMQEALAVVQALEPAGVGARSLGECLLLQLRANGNRDLVAEQMVTEQLKALADKRYEDVARALMQPIDCIMRALATIRLLEPRPGRPFDAVPAQAVRPEATILKAGDAYRVVLRGESEPAVRVTIPRSTAASAERGEARQYLAHRVERASRIVTAVELGRSTIQGVVESIAHRQPGFLEHGVAQLRPLSLRQVADDVGVHDSTVSRTVAHRYIDTPHGIFPLRFFFTNRLPADPDGVVSSAAVRQRIREMVGAEDPAHPLLDVDIAEALSARGMPIARRTVVKYRDQLGIARAQARRSICA